MIRKKLIAGNWKMNKGSGDAVTLVKDIIAEVGRGTDVDIVVCPPFTVLDAVGQALEGSVVKLGAQNMHPEPSGAYTPIVLRYFDDARATSYQSQILWYHAGAAPEVLFQIRG